jgi:hypothetical protein
MACSSSPCKNTIQKSCDAVLPKEYSKRGKIVGYLNKLLRTNDNRERTIYNTAI